MVLWNSVKLGVETGTEAIVTIQQDKLCQNCLCMYINGHM